MKHLFLPAIGLVLALSLWQLSRAEPKAASPDAELLDRIFTLENKVKYLREQVTNLENAAGVSPAVVTTQLVQLAQPDGTVRAVLGVLKDEVCLILYDSNGKVRLSRKVTADGGEIGLVAP